MELSIREVGRPGDLGWVVMAHGEFYAREFGWSGEFDALVARIVADFADRQPDERERAWIAEADGRRVGCIFCVRKDESTAQLRILLVDPAVRGAGIGRRLVETCVDFATAVGYERMVLWTNDPLVAAARIYRAAGFLLIDEEPHHSFGADLVGQHYAKDLR